MEYVVLLLLIVAAIYPFSYAKYNWNKKNKLGAVGSILLAVSSVIIPSVVWLLR